MRTPWIKSRHCKSAAHSFVVALWLISQVNILSFWKWVVKEDFGGGGMIEEYRMKGEKKWQMERMVKDNLNLTFHRRLSAFCDIFSFSSFFLHKSCFQSAASNFQKISNLPPIQLPLNEQLVKKGSVSPVPEGVPIFESPFKKPQYSPIFPSLLLIYNFFKVFWFLQRHTCVLVWCKNNCSFGIVGICLWYWNINVIMLYTFLMHIYHFIFFC